jgi:hypothetical protein
MKCEEEFSRMIEPHLIEQRSRRSTECSLCHSIQGDLRTLTPIEKMWGIGKCSINSKQCNTPEELSVQVQGAWLPSQWSPSPGWLRVIPHVSVPFWHCIALYNHFGHSISFLFSLHPISFHSGHFISVGSFSSFQVRSFWCTFVITDSSFTNSLSELLRLSL